MTGEIDDETARIKAAVLKDAEDHKAEMQEGRMFGFDHGMPQALAEHMGMTAEGWDQGMRASPTVTTTPESQGNTAFKQSGALPLEERKAEGLSTVPPDKPQGQTPEDKAVHVIPEDTLEEDRQWLKERKKTGAEEALEYQEKYGTPRRGPAIIDGLTVKADKFCKLVAYGDSLTAAYATAFKPPKSSKRTIERAASELAQKPEVKERIQHYIDQLNNKELRAATRSIDRWFDRVWQLADEADTDATKATALRMIGAALGIGKHLTSNQQEESVEELDKKLKAMLQEHLRKIQP